MVKGEQITKAEAARRWSVSPSMIAKYLRKGMPACVDGGLDWQVVDRWRAENIIPELSGSWKARTRDKAPVAPGSAIAAQPREDGCPNSGIDVLNRLHGPGMVRLVEVAKALGLNPAQQVAAVHIVTGWIHASVGDALVDQCGPNGVEVDYSGLDEIRLTGRQQKESDALVDIADIALGLF